MNCPKCGEIIGKVKYDKKSDKLHRTCPACGFVKIDDPLDAKPSQEEVEFGKAIDTAIQDDLNLVGGIEKAIERDMEILNKAMNNPKLKKVLFSKLNSFVGRL